MPIAPITPPPTPQSARRRRRPDCVPTIVPLTPMAQACTPTCTATQSQTRGVLLPVQTAHGRINSASQARPKPLQRLIGEAKAPLPSPSQEPKCTPPPKQRRRVSAAELDEAVMMTPARAPRAPGDSPASPPSRNDAARIAAVTRARWRQRRRLSTQAEADAAVTPHLLRAPPKPGTPSPEPVASISSLSDAETPTKRQRSDNVVVVGASGRVRARRRQDRPASPWLASLGASMTMNYPSPDGLGAPPEFVVAAKPPQDQDPLFPLREALKQRQLPTRDARRQRKARPVNNLISVTPEVLSVANTQDFLDGLSCTPPKTSLSPFAPPKKAAQRRRSVDVRNRAMANVRSKKQKGLLGRLWKKVAKKA